MVFWVLSFNKPLVQVRGDLVLCASRSVGHRLPIKREDLFKIAHYVFEYSAGFVMGFFEYMVETFHCIKQLTLHPVASFIELTRAIYHYEETYWLVKNCVMDILKKYPTYGPAQRARLHAMVLTELTWWLLPLNISLDVFSRNRSVAAWKKNALELAKPKLEPVVETMKRILPVPVPLKTNGWVSQYFIVAAEWFASEEQPSQRQIGECP